MKKVVKKQIAKAVEEDKIKKEFKKNSRYF